MTNPNPLENRNLLSKLLYAYFCPLEDLTGDGGQYLEDFISDVAIWNVKTGHISVDPRESEERFWGFDFDKGRTDPEYSGLALSLIEEEVAELRDAVEGCDKVETLDAIADILFTLFGLAAKAGLATKVAPALREVIISNDTKIPRPGEEPVISPSGKIGKRKGYMPPNLNFILNQPMYYDEKKNRDFLFSYLDEKENRDD